MATSCDIARAAAAAALGGVCVGSSPPPACAVLDQATKRDFYFRTEYAPAGLASAGSREARARELGDVAADIAADAAAIAAGYGGAPPPTWAGMTRCLWSPDGSPGGPHGNRYISRDDLTSMGYAPQPLFGGAALAGRAPAAAVAAVPVAVDRLVGPDLAVALFVGLALAVLAALLLAARRDRKKTRAPPAAPSAAPASTRQ